jgi:hypothetical protein
MHGENPIEGGCLVGAGCGRGIREGLAESPSELDKGMDVNDGTGNGVDAVDA